MIINTGMRTDIPAFYSDWLINRLDAGFVLVQNPYKERELIRYRLDPSVVDIISFCTKNPYPMLSRIDKLQPFRQYWHVTITPYERDIERNVPRKDVVISAFQELSSKIGSDAITWRYDPIIINDKYSLQFHIEMFSQMAEKLSGYTKNVVISFVDLYPKTIRNCPGIREVATAEKAVIAKTFSYIAQKNKLRIKTCAEGDSFSEFGIDTSGCMNKESFEKALGINLDVPRNSYKRKGCTCLLSADIGAYNSCMHLCSYCYANSDSEHVIKNNKLHNPQSPLLIGDVEDGDIIRDAEQHSYISTQLTLDL